MGTNAFLDIAIGLMLMYLVLSLISTVLNEYIATKMKLRASTLKDALEEILDNTTLRNDFYDHGLIDGANKAVGGGIAANENTAEGHVSYLSGQTFAMAVLGSVDPTKSIPAFADVKSAIETMPDCNIRDVLLAQLAAANGSLDALRNNVANYFDATMDRVSGIYKRKLKWISLLVGIGIVVVLNADSIAVGAALWKDASLRAQMVQNAGAVVASGQGAALPSDKESDAIKTRISTLEEKLRPLPIGLDRGEIVKGFGLFWKAMPWENSLSWTAYFKEIMKGASWTLMKVIGLFITALAISLGAPFWFDMLSKFMNLRGSGPPPDRTATPQPPAAPSGDNT
jgi:hypothetical protein